MSSYNKVILMGNLTRDPDVRTTTTDLKIAKLGLAVNRKFRGKDNEVKEEVTFVDIDAFGRQAETLEKYANKGTALLVEGRLRLDTWQDTQTGANRSKLGVVLENFQFIGSRSGSENNSAAAPQSSAPAADTGYSDDLEDEDIPF